jgi:hypothetical protein
MIKTQAAVWIAYAPTPRNTRDNQGAKVLIIYGQTPRKTRLTPDT